LIFGGKPWLLLALLCLLAVEMRGEIAGVGLNVLASSLRPIYTQEVCEVAWHHVDGEQT